MKQMRWNAAAGLAFVLFLCSCQSGTQLPRAPVIGATCQTLSGSCLILSSPPPGVACVKFCNLTRVPGDAGGEAPVLVAAVAARWVDRQQLLEVELGNGLQLLGQP